MAQQQQAIHKFVLGSKELEGKVAEFGYDKGWYSITDIVGEEREVIYHSKNAQEAYAKWNVYIGRKKERPVPEERRRNDQSENTDRSKNRSGHSDRGNREGWDNNRSENGVNREERPDNRGENRENREYRENRENRNNRDRDRDRNRNRQNNRDNNHGGHGSREEQGNREMRRDRRRNRSDRSRRDREAAEQQ